MTDNLLTDLKMTTNDYNNVGLLLLDVYVSQPCLGDHHPTAVFSGYRVPGSVTHQTFRIQANPSFHDDVMGNSLLVMFHLNHEDLGIDVIIAWAQAWMNDRTSFYITRALIGACEGGFIPGTILFTTYFYKSKELSVRLAAFWATLNVSFPD